MLQTEHTNSLLECSILKDRQINQLAERQNKFSPDMICKALLVWAREAALDTVEDQPLQGLENVHMVCHTPIQGIKL